MSHHAKAEARLIAATIEAHAQIDRIASHAVSRHKQFTGLAHHDPSAQEIDRIADKLREMIDFAEELLPSRREAA
jgi:hypothetical protein